jgi:hypothetical protein
MPGVTTLEHHRWIEVFDSNYSNEDINGVLKLFNLVLHTPGQMTGRDFMQFWGTEIGRKMYSPIWINKTLKTILREGSELALITDVRFPDEIEAIKKAGGVVIRLTKIVNPEDKHISETSLDVDVYDWDNFDYIVDNQYQTLNETMLTVEKLLTGVV